MALPRSEGNLYFDTYDNIPSGNPEGMVVHTKGKTIPSDGLGGTYVIGTGGLIPDFEKHNF